MWAYVLLILLPILVQHINLKGTPIDISRSRRNYRSMKLFWGLLLVLLMFRHESVGRDLRNYKYIFTMISKSSWSDALWRSAEVGYNFLNKVISLFTNDFQWLIVVTAILSVYCIAKAYLQYTEDSSLSIALFITMSNFVLLFSGIRQSIAISLGFVAFECVKRKKLLSFLIIVIFAMLFHTSAFILLFMYPLYHIKITRTWRIAIVPLLAVLWGLNEQIFGFLSAILMRFTKYDAEISSTGAITMLILFGLFAVFSFLIPEETELDDDTIGMRNLLLFSVVLQMFAPLHSLAMRMNYYYIAFIPLLIPKIIKCRSDRWNNVAIVARHLMVLFFVVYFFLTAPKDNVLDIFPYKFFWER